MTIRYSDDARINSLFMDAEVAGELDDAMYAHQWDPNDDPDQEDQEDRPVTYADVWEDAMAELERDAQDEELAQDRAYVDDADFSWQEAEAEAMMAMYDDDPNPYCGTYSEM